MWWRFRWLAGLDIPTLAFGFFCEQCAAFLATGMAISEAVQHAVAASDPEIERIAKRISAPLAAGVSLAEALKPYRRRLPAIMLPVLETTVPSGTGAALALLADALNDQADFEGEFQYRVFNRWAAGLALVIASAAYWSSDPGIVLAGLFVVLRSLACLGVLYCAAWFLLKLFDRWRPTRYVVESFKLVLPQIQTVTRNIATVRWARSFMTLWESGIPVPDALEIAARSTHNVHYERILMRVAAETRSGKGLADSLAGTSLLPPVFLMVIAGSEETGNLGDALVQLVGTLEEDALTTSDRAVTAVGFAMQISSAIFLYAVTVIWKYNPSQLAWVDKILLR